MDTSDLSPETERTFAFVEACKENWIRAFYADEFQCGVCKEFGTNRLGFLVHYKGADYIRCCENCYRKEYGWPEYAHAPIDDEFGDLS